MWRQAPLHRNHLDIEVGEAERVLVEKSKETYVVGKGENARTKTIGGKTVEHYRNDFKSFICWYRNRFNVYVDPFKSLTGWDKSVKEPRRDLTIEEVGRLIRMSPFERGTIYWCAVVTGLRRGELSALTDDSYSYNDSLIYLSSDEDKERESRVVYLSNSLNERLKKYIEWRGVCNRLFAFDFGHAIRYFDADCKVAGIEKVNSRGKVVFHSLRDTQINLGIEIGLDHKTGMELSRHKTIKIYLDKYAKRKNEKIIDAINSIGELVDNSIDQSI